MPQTTLCKNCGVILNLPAKVIPGKRLKCPRCGLRFAVSVAEASSASTMPGLAYADPATQYELETKPPSLDDLPLPTAEGDLRDTFNLPLMGAGRDAERSELAPDPLMGDAASLFSDPGPSRRRTSAESRGSARRCRNCGGVVPQGMSICATCGLDQETGLRVGLDDDLAPPPPPPPSGPPLHVLIVGGFCGVCSVILLLVALIQSVRGSGGWEYYGWLCLALVSAFGSFATVQFIRGKSAKLLMLALSLGIIVDLVAMVAVPLLQANFEAPDRVISREKTDDLDASGIRIKPPEERLDAQRITLGAGLTLVYAGLSLYLMSPPVKKYLHLRADRSPW